MPETTPTIMPSRATITGTLLDAQLNPVAGGKVVAVLTGSDHFDGGVRIVSQKIEATTNERGEYQLELIVNGEGENAATAWDVTGYNAFVEPVFQSRGLFVATADPATMSEIERTSEINRKAARDGVLGRLIYVESLAEYQALPASQRRDSDTLLVLGA